MPPQQPPPNPPPSVSAHQTAELEEARIRNLETHEEAVLIDLASGSVIWRKRGQAASVAFTPAEISQMSGQVLTHNHPLGWRFPLTDVAMLVDGRLAEIRAISPNYIHSLRPPAPTNRSSQSTYFRTRISTMSYQDVVYQVTRYSDVVRQRSLLRIHNPNDPLTRDEASANHWHEVMELLAIGWGVEYERKEWIP